MHAICENLATQNVLVEKYPKRFTFW
jgi:hypothetical protein